MNRWMAYFSFICMFGLLLPGPGPAQEKGGENGSVTRLEEVVVTATRSKESVKDVNANITVINKREIERSPARNLGELLEEESIGHIEKTPGNRISVGIRGFRTNATGNDLQGGVLVLLNGRRAGTGNVAKIMTENIERIEILRGPASVQYGSAAIGGVVNVITRQGEGDISAFAEGKLGSFGYEKAGAGISGERGAFDFSATASRSSRDSYDTADGDEYRNTGYDEKESISVNLGYEIVPNNRIGLIYTGYEAEEVGAPYYLIANDTDDYVDNSNESMDMVYNGATPDNRFSWKARYFFGRDEYRFMDPVGSNPDFYDDGIADETETDFKGAQAQISWNPDHYTLTAGADWINYEIEQDYAPNKTEYDNPSYFLLGKAQYFEDRLSLSGGLRYDDYEVEIKEGQGGTESNDHVTPRIGAAYFVLEDLKVRVSYGQGFRMPSARELAGDYTWGIPYQGNPDLDPEKSNTYEAGIDWYHRALETSLTYFYTDFEDKIDQVRTAGGVYTWKNLSEAKISGFEGRLSYDLAALWNGAWEIKPYFSATYLTDMENEETGEDLLYTSELSLSYGLSVSDPEGGLSGRLNFAYIGEQDIEYYNPTTYATTRMEKAGFTVADLSVQKRITDWGNFGGLHLRGEIKNLLDKQYAYVKGYPMPGRNFALSLKYTY